MSGLLAHAAVRQPELSVTNAPLLSQAIPANVTLIGEPTPGRCEACGAICWDGITPRDCLSFGCTWRQSDDAEKAAAVMQVLQARDITQRDQKP